MPERSDPFEELRAGYEPIDPQPAFTSRLLARVERALYVPKGVTVSDLNLGEDGAANGPAKVGDIGYLSLQVGDVGMAMGFYGEVLGWAFEEGSGPQSRLVAGSRPHHGLFGGQDSCSLMLCYMVDDVEAALTRVADSGGTSGDIADRPYGRVVDCVDNQGMGFALYEPPAGEWPSRPDVNGTGHGDVAYVTIHVPDSSLARSFYSAVLGWEFERGHVEDGWGPVDTSPMMGLSGGHQAMHSAAMYRVDDIEAAAAAVRRLGGTATDVEQQPYGLSSECRDNQGAHFWLGQL